MSQFIRSIKSLNSKSFFLFGARGVGKSTFIHGFLSDQKALNFDLLNPALEDKYAKQPEIIESEIVAQIKEVDWVVIDEVQKCPKLLNVVHKLIVQHKIKFILSGQVLDAS